ncbi:light chain of dynein [Chloropicon roscoffensis]|uniref:Dynein light chain 1, cytoplasmic n=1 Tax=Chloropicon roscoffensis TaxID=1461544 RepID=A0A7S3FRE5_9CHLO|mmetsp:Transcript_6523/g.19671  ORF Transcript_6523/g.19671 Transcript_6523/m.19671 type:complete len:191 (+) Transcript_6523:29-601(+)
MHTKLTRKRATILAKGSWLDELLRAKGYYLQNAAARKALFPKTQQQQQQLALPSPPPPCSSILADVTNRVNDELATPPSSRVETSLGSSMSPLRATVLRADMSTDAVALAVQVATDAILLAGAEDHRGIAKTLKEEFDRELMPAWQCVVGQRFGSFVTHASGTFVYFTVGDLAILLFRTIPAGAAARGGD